jgi:6-phosphofructokinase 1
MLEEKQIVSNPIPPFPEELHHEPQVRHISRIGILTSGGDSQGMNAALRGVVRAGIRAGLQVYAIYEGYQGMVQGGELIQRMAWHDVSGILQQGGTIIGSARSSEFYTRPGRRKAALNLLRHGIEGLVVIGGDGSLTGANLFRQEWHDLLHELVQEGQLTQAEADAHPHIGLVGMVGSIDNDMFGTDMTIGADTALHRIVEAVDAIAATAASHQRTFVVEVMGRNCGYLALMASLATGANWVLIPESPPEQGWEDAMCGIIRAGRGTGRRHSVILIAEGAIDRAGKLITSDYVRKVLSERLREDSRVTILGHVQRGGAPSAFDRTMPTLLGYAAVRQLLHSKPQDEPQLIGMRNNRISISPLMENVRKTHRVAELIKEQRYAEAMEMRGRGFVEAYDILHTLLRAQPHPPPAGQRQLRILVMHADGPAPGMNTAVRAAVRLGLDKGHAMLAVRDGLVGFAQGAISEMQWTDVHGWVARGGAELGANRRELQAGDYVTIAEHIRAQRIDGLLIIGGWMGYKFAYELHERRDLFSEFGMPIICLPASINNDLPGTEVTIGADTALNTIQNDLDKLKEAALAARRCFVAEVMGFECGYLALMAGLATGAERVYIPEEGITLDDLRHDVDVLVKSFRRGKRVGLIVRSERADMYYTTDFVATLFEREGGGELSVRRMILGNTQQGGRPSPFDRIQATRLASKALDYLIAQIENNESAIGCIGRWEGRIQYTNLQDMPGMMQAAAQRPNIQPWLTLRRVAQAMAEEPADA